MSADNLWLVSNSLRQKVATQLGSMAWKNHENILRVVRCLVDFVVLCDSKILQKFFVRDLVDFSGLLGCFLVGIYFPYCNWIILVSSDRKYFSLIVVEWLWGKRSHHNVSSCVANDDKPCIWACFWQTLQKMSVGCIHQDFQVVLFLLMFLSKITKSYRKNLQALMAQKQTWWWPMHSKAGGGGVLEAHVGPSIDKTEKRGPILQEILRRLVVVLAEHLQLHSMKNRWGFSMGKHRALSFADLSHEDNSQSMIC